MGTRVVVMALIPASAVRGSTARADLGFAPYGRVTWEWWCARHGVELVVLDRPVDSRAFAAMEPEYQRWLAIEALFTRYGPDTRMAIVDADTMIRWDAPDLFDAAGDRLAAVADLHPRWVCRDIDTYQSFFPGVRLPWWEYFNSGVVVLGAPHLPLIGRFCEFVNRHWPQLTEAQKAGQPGTGTDQTPLNFIVRHAREPVRLLPPPFNLLHCVPMTRLLWEVEHGIETDVSLLVHSLRTQPDMLEFIDHGYVWHFNNVVETRRVVMSEVWRAIAAHYPGAALAAESTGARPGYAIAAER